MIIDNSKSSHARTNPLTELLAKAPDLKFTILNGARAASDSFHFVSASQIKKGKAVSLFRKKELIFFIPTDGAPLEEGGVTEIRVDVSTLYARSDRREVLSEWLDAIEAFAGIQLDRECVREISRPWPRVQDKHVFGHLSCGTPRTLEEVLSATNSEEEKGGNCES
ncbi:hypothetical protein N8612_03870 [Verrucomicrobia bacterium]|nr:hypothetical protein [Verrucomicrobiota bacterium]